jgi:tRNA nucleotidyltransferase/poly(A) polymerase
MKLDQLLSFIDETANRNKISQPFMVGGVPRDRILGSRGTKTNIKDIDITTGDKNSIKLAELLHKNLPSSNYNKYDDGHSSVDFRGVHIDFSSNFVAPGVKNELIKMGVKDINLMKLELFSRDFTMNTLLEKLDFSAIFDITGEGIEDIQSKIIKCPIDPNITIGVDPRRILRAIKFSIKYGFSIEDNLKRAMQIHRKKISNLPAKFLQEKATEIIRLDTDMGIDMLIEYKLLPLIPLNKTLSDILIQKKELIRAL